MAQCILFQDAGCIGSSAQLSASVPDLRSWGIEHNVWDHWNDQCSSVIIKSGQWQFFEHINYEGQASDILGPGSYPSMEFLKLPNDTLSSVKLVSE